MSVFEPTATPVSFAAGETIEPEVDELEAGSEPAPAPESVPETGGVEVESGLEPVPETDEVEAENVEEERDATLPKLTSAQKRDATLPKLDVAQAAFGLAVMPPCVVICAATAAFQAVGTVLSMGGLAIERSTNFVVTHETKLLQSQLFKMFHGNNTGAKKQPPA